MFVSGLSLFVSSLLFPLFVLSAAGFCGLLAARCSAFSTIADFFIPMFFSGSSSLATTFLGTGFPTGGFVFFSTFDFGTGTPIGGLLVAVLAPFLSPEAPFEDFFVTEDDCAFALFILVALSFTLGSSLSSSDFFVLALTIFVSVPFFFFALTEFLMLFTSMSCRLLTAALTSMPMETAFSIKSLLVIPNSSANSLTFIVIRAPPLHFFQYQSHLL